MTLSSETVKVQYSGDGSTTAFPITFAFWDSDDPRVIHTVTATGVETVWTRGTQYTITGGEGATGTLNVVTSPTDYTPASDTRLTIKSDLDDTQPTDLPLGGAFPSASVEQQLDKLVRLVQQKEERLNRAILLQESSTASAITIDDPAAGEFLRWDAGAEGIESADITASGSIGIPVSIANGGTNAITAAGARTNLAVPGLADNNTMTGTLIMSGKALYEAEGASVASATTPSASPIWAGDGNTIHLTGTTTITGFTAAPQAGVWKRIILDGAITFTHSANLNCQGGVDFVGAANDLVLVYADTTTQFDLFFFKASGASVVATKNDFLLYQDQKSSGSAGNTYTASGWRTGILNTEVIDTAGIGSLSSNAITLAAGSYEVEAFLHPGYNAANMTSRIRLQNTTDGTTTLWGVNNPHPGAGFYPAPCVLTGSFTIAVQKLFEIQVYPSASTTATVARPAMSKVYASVKLRRYA
jgi:hypothetical protein